MSNQIIIPFSTETATTNFRGMQNYENNYVKVTNPQPTKKIKKIFLTNLIIPKTYNNIIDSNNIVGFATTSVQVTDTHNWITEGVYKRRDLLSSFTTALGATQDTNINILGTSVLIYRNAAWTYNLNNKINLEIFGANFNATMNVTTATDSKYYIAFDAIPFTNTAAKQLSDPTSSGIKGATYTLPTDTQVVLIQSPSNTLSITYLGTTYTLTLTEGQYTENTLATEIQTQLRATVDSNFTCSTLARFGSTGTFLKIVHSSAYNWGFNFTSTELASASSLVSKLGGNSNGVYRSMISNDIPTTVSMDDTNNLLSLTYEGSTVTATIIPDGSSAGFSEGTYNSLLNNWTITAANTASGTSAFTYRTHNSTSLLYTTATTNWTVNAVEAYNLFQYGLGSGGIGYIFPEPMITQSLNSDVQSKEISLINDMRSNVMVIYYNGSTANYIKVPADRYTNATFASQLETEFKKINAGFSVSQTSGYLTISHSSNSEWYIADVYSISAGNGITWNATLSFYLSIGHDHILNKIGFTSAVNNESQSSQSIVMARPINLELDHIEFYSSVPFIDPDNNNKLLTIPISSVASDNENIKIDETYSVEIPNVPLTTIDFTIGSNGKRVDFNGGIVTGNIVLEY